MKVGIAHIGIVVKSLEDSIRFYENALGFRKHHDFELSSEIMLQVFDINSSSKVVLLESSYGALELFMLDDNSLYKEGSANCGINHFSVEVDNLDGYLKNLKNKEVKLKPLQKGDRTIWFAVDPDGILIELREIKK